MSGLDLRGRIAKPFVFWLLAMATGIAAHGYFKCTKDVTIVLSKECTQDCETAEIPLNPTESIQGGNYGAVTSQFNHSSTKPKTPIGEVGGNSTWLVINGTDQTGIPFTLSTTTQRSTFPEAVGTFDTRYYKATTLTNDKAKVMSTSSSSTDQKSTTVNTHITTKNYHTLEMVAGTRSNAFTVDTGETPSNKGDHYTIIHHTTKINNIPNTSGGVKPVESSLETTTENEAHQKIKSTNHANDIPSSTPTSTTKNKIQYTSKITTERNSNSAEHIQTTAMHRTRVDNPTTINTSTAAQNPTSTDTYTRTQNPLATKETQEYPAFSTDAAKHDTSLDTRIMGEYSTTTSTTTTQHNPTTTGVHSSAITVTKLLTTTVSTTENKTNTEEIQVTQAVSKGTSIETMQHTSVEKTTTASTSDVGIDFVTEFATEFATESPSCPTNMVHMNCTCQTTCEDPNRLNGCNCTEGEKCICPNGYYLKGENCVTPEECDCYWDAGTIISEGDVQLMLDCTQECSCYNGVLSCSNYQCDTNAKCENTSNSLQCYCKDGYHGDGVSCTRLSDCNDVYNAGLVEDDVYTVLPINWPGLPFQVYCKQGWTIFQRREDGSVDFYRNWTDYKGGFGNLRHELWLGLEKLYYLTNQGFYKLKISLVSDGTPYEINYSYFKVNNEANNYALQELGSYSGNIGFDYMTYHYSYQFSTYDRDNDNHNSQNCASKYYAGWWFVACWNVNLNGRYNQSDETSGICLNKRGYGVKYCNIPFTEMSITHV